MNKRRFIQLGIKSVAGLAALSLVGGQQLASAQNRTQFDRRRLFRGFKNNEDAIFQGFAYHAFHNGRAPRIVHPDGGYTFFIDSFVGYKAPETARVADVTPRSEPGYWLVAAKLDEMYNTGIHVERFRGKRLDVLEYALQIYADDASTGSASISDEMRHFIHGIKSFMDKYSVTSRHSDRASISNEDIERHFMASICFAAYRNSQEHDAIERAVDVFMRASISQRDAMLKDICQALSQLGRGKNADGDPDNPYNRQYVASWSSYVLGTALIVMLGDVETGQLLDTNIETPLRRYVARIRPYPERGESVLKI